MGLSVIECNPERGPSGSNGERGRRRAVRYCPPHNEWEPEGDVERERIPEVWAESEEDVVMIPAVEGRGVEYGSLESVGDGGIVLLQTIPVRYMEAGGLGATTTQEETHVFYPWTSVYSIRKRLPQEEEIG